MDDVIFEPRMEQVSRYMADYFGLWMIHEEPFIRMVNHFNGSNLHVHLENVAAKQDDVVTSRDSSRMFRRTAGGIAVFEANGPMMKFVSSMSDGTSYLQLRREVNAARKSDEVKAGLIRMDTPGGTAKGNEDLANDLARFAAEKPLYAFVEDMTASAGVSLASQANKIYANNATAVYGSMGTYAVLRDMSGMAEQLGVTVHVIKAGEFKGMGEPGTEVTQEQIDEVQKFVNKTNDAYLGLIARGRGMDLDAVRELADGRIIMAADAVTAKLINGVKSFDETVEELTEEISGKTSVSTATQSVSVPSPPTETQEMADTPATLAELKQKFPNSTAEWRESQLEASATVTDAAISYAQHVEEQAKAREESHQKELDEAKAKAAKEASGASRLGHAPLTIESLQADRDNVTGDAGHDFPAAVETIMRDSNCSRQEAVTACRRRFPDLAQAYLIATNPDQGAQRELKERFDRLNRQQQRQHA